jgi:hypothetical protein
MGAVGELDYITGEYINSNRNVILKLKEVRVLSVLCRNTLQSHNQNSDIQILCFWTLSTSIVLVLFKNVSETGFCLQR